MLPGMSLEAVGNDGPRGMNAASPRATVGGAQNSAYSALSPAQQAPFATREGAGGACRRFEARAQRELAASLGDHT